MGDHEKLFGNGESEDFYGYDDGSGSGTEEYVDHRIYEKASCLLFKEEKQN